MIFGTETTINIIIIIIIIEESLEYLAVQLKIFTIDQRLLQLPALQYLFRDDKINIKM